MANNIDRPNMPDDDYKRDVIRRVEAILTEKESEKGAYLKRCQDLNARIDDVLEEAKNKGLPKKAVKGIIKLREFDRKKEALVESLEDDQAEILKSIEEALGEYQDTPLGAAAVSANNKATVGTAGKTTLEKGPGKKQDAATAAIVGAVLATEGDKPVEGKSDGGASQEGGDEDEEKRKIAAQRESDAAEFDTKPPVTVGENVTRLDPSAARRNRAGGNKTKADAAAASDAAQAAEATSAQREKGAPEGVKIAGAEPGAIKF